MSGYPLSHLRIRLGARDQRTDIITTSLRRPAKGERAFPRSGAADEQRSHACRIGVYVRRAALTEATAMSDTTKDERTWGMLAHIAAFAFFILPPVGGVLGPLIVWLIKRDQSPFVADQGREALNFNIAVLLAGFVCGILVYVLIGILLGVALFVFWMAATIVAGIRASEGIAYRHRFTLRLVK
jgi:uncharacterized protein